MESSEDEFEPQPLPLTPTPTPTYTLKAKPAWRGAGFVNRGNTCYLGATLQLLLHVPAFREWLMGCKFASGSIGGVLADICKSWRSQQTVDPEPLLRVLYRICPAFLPDRQEDASEFLSALLQCLVDEDRNSLVSPIHRTFCKAFTEVVTCCDCGFPSSVRHLFPLLLTLSVNEMNNIQEGINKYTEATTVTGRCEKCEKEEREKQKYLATMHSPPFLLLHLNRFQKIENGNDYMKNMIGISVTQSIVHHKNEYALKCVVIHHGTSMSFGHYTAVCRDNVKDNASWHHCDDNMVQKVDINLYLDSYLMSNVYLLCYEKQFPSTSIGISASSPITVNKDLGCSPLFSLSQLMGGLSTPPVSQSQSIPRMEVTVPDHTSGVRRKLKLGATCHPVQYVDPCVHDEHVTLCNSHAVLHNIQPAINETMVTTVLDFGTVDTSKILLQEEECSKVKKDLRSIEVQAVVLTTNVATQTYPVWSYEAFERGEATKFHYFTGVTKGQFMTLYELMGGDSVCRRLKYHYNDKTPVKRCPTIKISLKSRLFLVLVRMRRGWSLNETAEHFKISKTLSGIIFFTWVRRLAISCKQIAPFMFISAQKQNEKKPLCFLPFKNLRIVIDCTEFRIERSSNMQQQGNSFSDYKSCNTGKCAVAVSCYGGICEVSEVYEGRVSDKELIIKSGLLDRLQRGDVIMADRGFKIHEECQRRGIILIIPPSKKNGQALTAREEVQSPLPRLEFMLSM